MEDDESQYCICRKGYSSGQLMVQCEVCEEWFHDSCVGLSSTEIRRISEYHCEKCEKSSGPSIIRNCNEENFFSIGSRAFVESIMKLDFPRFEDHFTVYQSGEPVNLEMLYETHFKRPFLVNNSQGLGISMPEHNFSVSDVCACVGPEKSIHVIDVEGQRDINMTMKKWTEYYNAPEKREKIYNVISCEYSNTRMMDFIKPPKVVMDMSWVDNFWPPEHSYRILSSRKPRVMNYCLMSVDGSYTDFHVDFGGTSVWYHIFKGGKTFFLIEPTEDNLELYRQWTLMGVSEKFFLASKVKVAYRIDLKPGQTFFIPCGWIHSVVTTADSLVFGGNFIHPFNPLFPLRIYELEQNTSLPHQFQFPSFELVYFFSIGAIVSHMKGLSAALGKNAILPSRIVEDLKELIDILCKWQKQNKLKHIGSMSNIEKVVDIIRSDFYSLLNDQNFPDKQQGPVKQEEHVTKDDGRDSFKDYMWLIPNQSSVSSNFNPMHYVEMLCKKQLEYLDPKSNLNNDSLKFDTSVQEASTSSSRLPRAKKLKAMELHHHLLIDEASTNDAEDKLDPDYITMTEASEIKDDKDWNPDDDSDGESKRFKSKSSNHKITNTSHNNKLSISLNNSKNRIRNVLYSKIKSQLHPSILQKAK